MKNKLVAAVICLAAFAVVFMPLRPSTRGNVSITMNGSDYTMCAFSLQELMADGYGLSPMTTTGKEVRFYDYRNAELEANTEYTMGVSLRVKDTAGSQLGVWLYNPKSKPVDIREGMVRGITCDIAQLKSHGITVEVLGLTIDGQSKEELATWAEQELRGYQKTESENVNALSYNKKGGSYTFNFDENDIVTKAIVLQRV